MGLLDEKNEETSPVLKESVFLVTWNRRRADSQQVGCYLENPLLSFVLDVLFGKKLLQTVMEKVQRDRKKGMNKREGSRSELGGKLTLKIQTCVWTRCGHQTESDTGNQQTRRLCQMRRGGIRSGCHHGPVRVTQQQECVRAGNAAPQNHSWLDDPVKKVTCT